MCELAPKVFAVDYADIINNAMLKFLDKHNDEFKVEHDKLGVPLYVFSGKFHKTTFRRSFETYIYTELQKFKDEIDEKYPQFPTKTIVVIGSSIPDHNMVPNNFDQLGTTSKYALVESDIKIDIPILESIWDGIFMRYFKNDTNPDIFFFRHRRMNSRQVRQIIYSVFKTSFYGNEYEVKRRIIEDVNDRTVFLREKDIHTPGTRKYYLAIWRGLREVKEIIQKRLIERTLMSEIV